MGLLPDKGAQQMTLAAKHRRRSTAIGFTTAAAVLSLSSAAFACVIYTGQLDVTGNGGTSTSIGARMNPSTGTQYCVPPTDGAAAPAAGAVTVSVSPASICLDSAGKNQLRDGTYDVAFLPRAYTVRRGALSQTDQCFFPDNTVNTKLQTMGPLSVSSGSGSGQYAIPADAMKNGPNNRAAVCIREQQAERTFPSSAHGNSAAVTVL